MHLFKNLVLIITLLFPLVGNAASQRRPLKFHVGVGYNQFNETMTITDGTTESVGTANYAGPSLIFEMSQTFPRTQFGSVIIFSSGKAAAGNFDGSLTFDDAVNRGWWAVQVNPYLNARVSRDFQVGGGPLIKIRNADWSPQTSVINVRTSSAYAFGIQINLRLNLVERLSVVQSYAVLDADGHNQWLFFVNYRL